MLGQRACGGVHPGEVRLPGLVVNEERDHEDDRVRTGDGLGVVRGGTQAAGRDQLAELVLEEGLTREGLGRLVDEPDGALGDVDPDDLVALLGVLDGQGQPDLSQGDDGDTHPSSLSPGRQALCLTATRIAASARAAGYRPP